MNRTFAGPMLVAALGWTMAAPAFAHVRLGTQSTRPPVVQVIDNATKIDANKISMFVTNNGSFAYDLGGQVSGLEFPKGTGNTCVYAAGLWLGAKVAGETRVTVAEYSQEFTPGPMIGGVYVSSLSSSRFTSSSPGSGFAIPQGRLSAAAY